MRPCQVLIAAAGEVFCQRYLALVGREKSEPDYRGHRACDRSRTDPVA
jgi:hypothetical protein